MTTDPAPGRRTRRPLVLVACMLAMFMSAVEATIVATAMPTIIGDLGGFDLFSWVFSIYLLTQAITIPVYGKLADMYGRKPAFYFGATVFLAGSALAGLSTSMVQLIAFRALQGVGAGAIMPIASTVIGDVYPGAERGRVMGWLSSVWGFSAVVGPALGAFFVQHVHWSLVFWLNLPIGALSVTLLALFLHEDVTHHAHRIDYAGAGLLVTGISALMLGLVQGASLGAGAVGALLALAAACLTGFLVVERRAAEPMIPLDLWRDRTIAAGNAGQLGAGAVMIAVTTFVPTYVQGVMGRSPTAAGFALTAMSIGWPVAATLSGHAMARVTFRKIAATGSLALLAGSIVLVLLTPARGPAWAGAGAFLVGLGMGMCNTVFVVSAQTRVNWNRRGVATSVSLFMRLIGQSTGAALYGALLNLAVARDAPAYAGTVNRMLLPQARTHIEPAHIELLTRVIQGALHEIYLIAALLSALTLVLALQIPARLAVTSEPD